MAVKALLKDNAPNSEPSLGFKIRVGGGTVLQGQPRQTVFFELALRDRNMQVRFFWKMFLES